MQCSRLILFLLILAIPATCFSWPAKVVSVVDGDTINVIRDGKQVKIRLYGIDTPEKGQAFGQKAQDLTTALVAGRNVEVEQKDVDRYGRIVGLVKIDGQSLNELIVQNGYAWVYRQYCKDRFCSDWIKSESIAKQQKKGMWKESVVVPPWEWRAAQRGEKQEQESAPVILIGENKPASDSISSRQFRCDGRTHCSHMRSCEEAKFFLKNCPGTKMDGDNDGVPCEKQWCH